MEAGPDADRMDHRNYQKELDEIIEGLENAPTLLLHACCAPCSSYVLEYLSRFFRITLFYYNPNITDEAEYRLRSAEAKRLVSEMNLKHPVRFLEGPYEPDKYLEAVKGLEKEPEGGARCEVCFKLRIEEAAKEAVNGGYDFFTTTLTISPLKNAPLLNMIGEKAAAEAGLTWLPSDFKKKGGYQRSIELSKVYGLYRQDYCGCVFSKRNRAEVKGE